MVGLNHACWSVEHSYDGEDLDAAASSAGLGAAARTIRRSTASDRRSLQLAATMESIPADYFQYYYFRDEVLAELAGQADDARRGHPRLGRPTTGSTTREQARSDDPQLDPARSRGGIHELELAIDVMDAVFNDKDEVHPVNVPNRGGALPGFPDDLVVEVHGRCDAGGHRAAPVAAAAPPRARARRDARRVPGARRRGRLVGDAHRRDPRALREPAGAAAASWPRRSTTDARRGAPPLPARAARGLRRDQAARHREGRCSTARRAAPARAGR